MIQSSLERRASAGAVLAVSLAAGLAACGKADKSTQNAPAMSSGGQAATAGVSGSGGASAGSAGSSAAGAGSAGRAGKGGADAGSAGKSGADAGSAGSAGKSGAGAGGNAGAGVAGQGVSGEAGRGQAGGGQAGVAGRAGAGGGVMFLDDFNGGTLDPAWFPQNRAGDLGNPEQECYSPSQVAVGGGFLTITTVAQTTTCGDATHAAAPHPYLSGMVQWRTFNFSYGTLEFRARSSGGRGSWPAVWLLGANCQLSNQTTADNVGTCNWPNPGSQEIDVMEMLNNDYTTVHHNLFTSAGTANCSQQTSDTSQSYHVYRMVWTPSAVTFSIDGQASGCSHTSNVPSAPMFLMINNAVSTSWPANAADFPQTLSVDYVKVTQP